ncbi:MAG: uroporphyrinogen-III C-methyltransferase [Nevskia sp.]|jgi:uncharacterized protein HemX|nr:uroporphyrinogen-III C-methyltransferase [Nevskia sp.]MCK9383017.1 uroporphyrinogen-III C-methyltransferase [Nevskia sp.]
MTEYEVPAHPARRRGSRVWILLVLVLIAGGLGYGGWRLWQTRARTEDIVAAQDTLLRRLSRQLGDAQAEIQQVQQRQADLGSNLRRNIDDVAALQSRADDAEATITRINATLQGGRGRAQLVAVEQLLLIANERAQLAHDLRGALDALTLAQERLGALAEPKLFNIRQALAGERDAVAALPQSDVEGTALTLADLIKRAPQLPQRARAPQHLPPADTNTVRADGANNGWLARGWANLREVLGAVFILRRTDKPIDRLLPVEQEGLVNQLLLLKLETARAALLSGNTSALRGAANDAQTFLIDYYRAEDPAVLAARAELDRLRTLELTPVLPDLSRSLGLLRAYLDANPR